MAKRWMHVDTFGRSSSSSALYMDSPDKPDSATTLKEYVVCPASQEPSHVTAARAH